MLKEGTEAFVLWERITGRRSKSGDRSTLDGAARVRITGYRDGKYQTVVVKGSGVSEGITREFLREQLYVTPLERKYFAELCGWFWGGTPVAMKRPPIEED